MRRPLVSVVIVNWNTAPELARCLTSLRRHVRRTSFEVIVVDNDSRDGSREWLARQKGLEVVLNPGNRGFAPAVNQGLARARGKFTLLLNSDVTFREDALTPLVRFMGRHPRAGAAGAATFYPDGRLQRHIRPFPTLRMAFDSLAGLDRLSPRLFPSAETFMHQADHSRTRSCDQVAASYLILPTELFRKVGGMDERQFILYNDVDLCERLWKHGRGVWYVAGARVFHEGCVSTRRTGPLLRFRMYLDILRFFTKRRGAAAVLLLSPVLAIRWAVFVAGYLFRKDRKA